MCKKWLLLWIFGRGCRLAWVDPHDCNWLDSCFWIVKLPLFLSVYQFWVDFEPIFIFVFFPLYFTWWARKIRTFYRPNQKSKMATNCPKTRIQPVPVMGINWNQNDSRYCRCIGEKCPNTWIRKTLWKVVWCKLESGRQRHQQKKTRARRSHAVVTSLTQPFNLHVIFVFFIYSHQSHVNLCRHLAIIYSNPMHCNVATSLPFPPLLVGGKSDPPHEYRTKNDVWNMVNNTKLTFRLSSYLAG